MTVAVEVLRELHRVHQSLQDVRQQIERGPAQLQARRQHVQRKKHELEQVEQELKRRRVQADQKELHLKSGEQKIAQLQQRLNEAKTNKEYQAVRDQIDADKMANSVLEDEILEAYAKLDEQRARQTALQQELAQATAELQQMEEAIGLEAVKLQGRAHELEQMLQKAEAVLPATVRDVYNRLVASRGADAMAPVETNTCGGCYTAITPQMYNELLASKLVFCKSCGRLLYIAEES